MQDEPRTHARLFMFVALCVCALAIAVGYVLFRQSPSDRSDTNGSASTAAQSLDVVNGQKAILFTSASFDRTNGYLGFAPFAGNAGERYRAELRCERVHFAKGSGICLSAERGVITTFSAKIFGSDFRVRQSFVLHGVPSRARVSPDGRRGAITVFVSGDSYSSSSFSTRTTLVDMSTGQPFADLEEFAVTRDGVPFKAIDFNFWGVTFAQDGNRFFATLRTGTHVYLIEGDADKRTARLLRDAVECPSLSPDNARIVFKKRVSQSAWRLHLLDVATLVDTPLGETRSVDDQVEWLDNHAVAYMLPSAESSGGGSDIWSVAVDGAEPPRILLRGAVSPTMLQP